MITSVSQVPVSQSEIDSLPVACPVEQLEIPGVSESDMTLTPPDSIKLTVLVSAGIEPRTATFTPGALTSGIPRELATHIAIELNRDSLRNEHLQQWHLVAYGHGLSGRGFCVVRVRIPSGWKPRSEYETPPSADCGLMNIPTRMSIKAFNQMQMAAGGPVKFWQLHIKPLEYPKASLRDDLNEFESEVVTAAVEGLAGHLHVQRARNGEISLQFNGELNSVRWSPEKETPADLARQFRRLAQRFQDAARSLDGRDCTPNGVTLHAIQSNERLIRISGFDDVHLLIENAKDDESAFARAREAMSLIAG